MTAMSEETRDENSAAQHAPAASARARGSAAIAAALKTLPDSPGVYRMLDAKGEVLYVGKAKDLKKRVASYTQMPRLSYRIQRMVAETASLEVVTTHTEVEALLLESNLIKRHAPRYNVLLRDDKSFPYILLTGDHAWPQITKYRGARSRAGEYFGPFASAGAVNQTLAALERAFLLRSCADTVFASRSRPCLLFQIRRCSGPCVGKIDAAGYAELVSEARAFLSGRSREVQRRLAGLMQEAATALDYESAAIYRDRIKALTQIQAKQDINVAGVDHADVIAAHQAGGETCVQVFFFRAGRNYGNRAYFPRHEKTLGVEEVLAAFIGQFYENKPPPALVLLSHRVPEQGLIAEALAVRAGRRVELAAPRRGAKRKMVEHALANAQAALGRRLAESSTQRQLLEALAAALALDAPPQRIEVYDNSHIMGTNAVGAMVVAGPEGFIKGAYRKFNIKTAAAPGELPAAAVPAAGATASEAPAAPAAPVAPAQIAAGDDYGMMREVLTRRFARALKEDPERNRGQWPDLLLIDGGLGQLNAALAVLADLGVGDVALAAIAKGPERNAGRERIFLPGRPPLSLAPRDPVLYFLQRLRDEAHRFAIGTHRARRAKSALQSRLDEVPGIGAKRKRALLHHFGSAQSVSRAGLADLAAVAGISTAVAKKVYDHFHPEG
ncbi:MAG TPA: excinuclease ABC subunit UvrC [Alphaproteobacteria bacterium]|nr:excinuclease ABC subunit UvrC [Alphaproteobacteria bacterium]